MMRYTAVLALLMFTETLVLAQNVLPMDTIGTEEGEVTLGEFLPPLTILIDSAIANSPDVQVLDYQLKATEYGLGAVRKDWSELVYVNGMYNYSDYDRILFIDQGLPQPLQAAGYQVAVGARIPLSYIINRKETLRSAKMEVQTAEAQKEARARQIREEVIVTYNQLLLNYRLISIAVDARESAEIILEMAEERFRQGEITIEDLTMSTDLLARYSTQHETLKAELHTTYARLERLVGMPLGKLQNLNE